MLVSLKRVSANNFQLPNRVQPWSLFVIISFCYSNVHAVLLSQLKFLLFSLDPSVLKMSIFPNSLSGPNNLLQVGVLFKLFEDHYDLLRPLSAPRLWVFFEKPFWTSVSGFEIWQLNHKLDLLTNFSCFEFVAAKNCGQSLGKSFKILILPNCFKLLAKP